MSPFGVARVAKFTQTFQRAVRVDLHHVEAGNLGLRQRQRPGQERAKASRARQGAEETAQLLGDAKGRNNICLGRVARSGFVVNEALRKVPAPLRWGWFGSSFPLNKSNRSRAGDTTKSGEGGYRVG